MSGVTRLNVHKIAWRCIEFFLKEKGLLANISIKQYFKEINTGNYHCKNYSKLSFHFPAVVRFTFKIWESNYRLFQSQFCCSKSKMSIFFQIEYYLVYLVFI